MLYFANVYQAGSLRINRYPRNSFQFQEIPALMERVTINENETSIILRHWLLETISARTTTCCTYSSTKGEKKLDAVVMFRSAVKPGPYLQLTFATGRS